MKLFHSPASPYVRKVMACAIARGIDGQIELVSANPHVSPPELLAGNPLSKIPCLITSDGLALYDSPVICEYLDSVAEGGRPMFPRQGGARWIALRQQALGDGLLDAAVLRRMEQGRPVEAARTAAMARQRDAIERGLDALEGDVPHQALDIGTITIGCALGYLDFRFGGEPWRPSRPKLAAWFDSFTADPSMARTAPR